MIDTASLRNWLLQQPRPAQLRLTRDGEPTLLQVAGQTWARVASSVATLEPELIEALDSKGDLIRATRPGEEDGGEESGQTTSAPELANGQNMSALVASEETRRFELFAKLLSEAYKHANDVAFAKLTDICNMVIKRGDNFEKTLDLMRRELAKSEAARLQAELEAAEADAEAERAKNGGGGEGDIATQMVSGMVRQAVANAGGSDSTSNGKGQA